MINVSVRKIVEAAEETSRKTWELAERFDLIQVAAKGVQRQFAAQAEAIKRVLGAPRGKDNDRK